MSDSIPGTTMGGHSYSNVLVHIIFSTKQRRNSIPGEKLDDLWRYFGGIARNHEIPLLRAGGTRNHAHLLVAMPATKTIAEVVGVLKSNSSKWLSPKFEWQVGYGAFAVSASNREKVIAYIDNQEKHHKKRTFEEEFLVFLKSAGVDTIRGTSSGKSFHRLHLQRSTTDCRHT